MKNIMITIQPARYVGTIDGRHSLKYVETRHPDGGITTCDPWGLGDNFWLGLKNRNIEFIVDISPASGDGKLIGVIERGEDTRLHLID